MDPDPAAVRLLIRCEKPDGNSSIARLRARLLWHRFQGRGRLGATASRFFHNFRVSDSISNLLHWGNLMLPGYCGRGFALNDRWVCSIEVSAGMGSRSRNSDAPGKALAKLPALWANSHDFGGQRPEVGPRWRPRASRHADDRSQNTVFEHYDIVSP
jgi:hypothetical protein